MYQTCVLLLLLSGCGYEPLEAESADGGAPLKASPTDPWLEGVVFEEQEPAVPIAGVLVAVQGHGLLVTQEEGTWRLQVPAGSYAVTATAVGYELGTKICDVVHGVPVNRCDMGLRRVGPPLKEPPTSTRSGPGPEPDNEGGGCSLAQGEPGSPLSLLGPGLVLLALGIRCSSRTRP
jgi:hypothetical protein